MPTETKKSTANASRIGSASDAARTLNSDRPTTMPARNAPSAIETPKSCGRADRDAEREDEHREREELARAGGGDAGEQPRHDASAADENEARSSAATLSAASARLGRRRSSRPHSPSEDGGHSTSTRTVKRSSTTSQPTATWPARRVQIAIVREDAHEDDGARDGERRCRRRAPPPSSSRRHARRPAPSPVATSALRDRARHRDAADRDAALRRGTAARRRTSGG